MDIDLTLQRVTEIGDANTVVQRMLQRAVDVALGDWLDYSIGPYPVEARMDGRIFARFHLDAGIGDVVMQPYETITCRDWLGFAGVETSQVRMIGQDQQFAEKIHAYTLPRSAQNSRVKDLVDLRAAKGRSVIDFGSRRAPGGDAALSVARAIYLAGGHGTSNVLAGRTWGIPIFGTMRDRFLRSVQAG